MVQMTTRAEGSIWLDLRSWTLNSSVNLRPSPGTRKRSNSPSACLPRLPRSTRNKIRCAPARRTRRQASLQAVKVLPEPVAIWIMARGLSRASDSSRLTMAGPWAGRRLVMSTGSSCFILRRRPRKVLASGRSFASWSQRTIVSGRCTVKTSRLRGSGSRPLVNWVSMPVDS